MTITYAHLLIVARDEQLQAALLKPLRQTQWYELSTVANTAQALAQLRQTVASLVLIEATQAAADSFHFLRVVREDESLNQMQILVLAGPEQSDLVAQCLAAGADDYLLTPINPALLKARCDMSVQQHYLRDQLKSSVQAFEEMMALANDLRQTILPLGIALTVEKDFSRLLAEIVTQAKAICHADFGCLYLRPTEDLLQLAVAHHSSLAVDWSDPAGATAHLSPIPLAMPGPAARDVAAHAALTGQSVNVPDIYRFPELDFGRLQAFDARHGYRSVSCLAVPLANEQVRGVLQLINAQDPATGRVIPFTRYHQLVAESLASQAAVVLHNRLLQERQEALLKFERELQIGREIQAGFFPAELPQPAGWELAAQLHPAQEVCGDFYDVFSIPAGKLGLVVADVCGKGVGAALFMALIRSLVRAFVQQYYYLQEQEEETPAGRPRLSSGDIPALMDVVILTNEYINNNHHEDHMFATLFLAILDPATGRLVYVNAGHEPPAVFRQAGRLARLERTGPAVGLIPDAPYWVRELYLAPGETLLVYTDGVTEARDPAGQMLTTPALYKQLTPPITSATELLARIDDLLTNHMAGTEPSDDVTMLAVRRQPQP